MVIQATFIVRAYFILLTSGLLVIRSIPLTRRWMCYGKTLDLLDGHIPYRNSIFNLMVPKKWFIHFYIVSVLSTCFWINQIYRCLIHNKCNGLSYFSHDTTQPLHEVYICMLFMGIHGGRRLYECLVIQKHRDSQMWIGHYFLGLTYYFFCGIGMWCEGAGNVQNSTIIRHEFKSFFTITVALSTLIYVFFSWTQYLTHDSLSKLRADANSPKYSLPSTGLFKYLICPHYTSEIGIYFSFVILTRAQNITILIIFIWVVAILTISASETQRWRLKRFKLSAQHPPWIIFWGIY